MGSRVRRKEQLYSPYEVTIFYSDGSSEVADAGIHRNNTAYEFMSDVTGNPYPGMNPCYHLKVEASSGSSPDDYSKSVPAMGESPDRFIMAIDFPGPILNLEPEMVPPSSADLNEFLWDSAIKCATQVPEDVSIANFLWEIREEILKILKNLWEYIAKWLTPGGAYLGYHFCIKQIIQDLKKIKNVLKSAKKRLKHLKDTFGKPTTQRFRKKLEPEVFPPVEPFDPFDTAWIGCAFVCTHLVERRTTLHATWVTYHEFPGLDSAMALMDVLGAKLGLQNPIKIIWNAIPFSWLLDYFVSTGSFFDRLQLPSFKGEFTVLASCHGWKVEEKYQSWFVVHDWSSGSLQVNFRALGDLKVTHYVRRQGIPLGSIFTVQESLTQHQWNVIAALLSQFLGNRR